MEESVTLWALGQEEVESLEGRALGDRRLGESLADRLVQLRVEVAGQEQGVAPQASLHRRMACLKWKNETRPSKQSSKQTVW